MRFIAMVKANKDSEAGVMPTPEMLANMDKFNQELIKAGVMLSGGGLAPSSKGARIRVESDKRTVIDGPFAEGREAVLGFVAVRAADLDEACRLASESPFADLGGAIEVRMTSAFPKPVASGQSAGAQRGGGP